MADAMLIEQLHRQHLQIVMHIFVYVVKLLLIGILPYIFCRRLVVASSNVTAILTHRHQASNEMVGE